MTVRPFMAILPQQTQVGDEIVLKGRIKNDAQIFSVNLTLDCCPNPLNIAYQFKTNFVEKSVSQNYKKVGIWNEGTEDELSWIQGPGQEFIITFHFDDNELLIYSEDENRNFLYKFDYNFDIGDIKAVQIWDDLDYVTEVIYRYKPNQ
ncbi:uncharacterized protein LOC116337565 [Contarinia nasturtii]|uniref:uncharacterized protein LOC116337565 n=1 Tax=Contarinia nasturtii TaxID=265458 RepID=UPI0012D440B9|nr:uncharacterized protein LOC116337565 [Contarinia nasturtii]